MHVLRSCVLMFFLLGLIARSDATDQSGCGDVTGTWKWALGGTVQFRPGGSAIWHPTSGQGDGVQATWRCDPHDGTFVLDWAHGFTDRLTLSSDGERLAGTNQNGLQIEGYREALTTTPGASNVDPELVGDWLLEVQLPSPQGPVEVYWTIEPDGSYAVDAGPFSHAGTLNSAGTSYTLTATTSDYRDEGRYELKGWTSLITHGQHGVGRWNRHDRDLKLRLADTDHQLVPAGIPQITDEARRLARVWRDDALLSAIDYKTSTGLNTQPPSVRLRFFSPSAGQGMQISVGTNGTGFFATSSSRELAIPNGFLDLPEAWMVATQNGVSSPIKRASLRVWQQSGHQPVLAWTINGNASSVNIDAVNGTRLPGDLSGYVAAYNAQWEAARAGLRRLLARPHSSSGARPSTSTDGWSSSSSYDSNDSPSASGPDYGTASQNSWEAGDMRAYDRIQSGAPTGEDCARYGC